MHIIIGSILLVGVIVLSILLLCGLPLGELTMGGKHKVWPKEMRPLAIGQLVVQVIALLVLLAGGHVIPTFLPQGLLKALVIIFAIMFTGNIVMNAFSTSKKEKYIMTPVSVIAAVCFAIVALRM
ncbi:MAG: hypothetical protein K6F03_07860 [Saccharofermentans sp.]|nr:hypothetical protein [Saccharofermentans sp.]